MKKGLKYFLGRVSELTGNRTTDQTEPRPPNTALDLLVDEMGRAIVRFAGASGFFPDDIIPVIIEDPVIEYTDHPENSITGVELITTAANKFYGVSGTNRSVADLFLQIFDIAANPPDGTPCQMCYLIPAGQNYSIQPRVPRPFALGLAIAWSSTQTVLTAVPDAGTMFIEWVNT